MRLEIRLKPDIVFTKSIGQERKEVYWAHLRNLNMMPVLDRHYNGARYEFTAVREDEAKKAERYGNDAYDDWLETVLTSPREFFLGSPKEQ